MMDVVRVTGSSGTLSFTIQPAIIQHLDLKLKDPVEFDIYNENREIIMTLTRPLRKMGRGSMGVSIRFYVAMKLDIRENDVMQVDIRKGKK